MALLCKCLWVFRFAYVEGFWQRWIYRTPLCKSQRFIHMAMYCILFDSEMESSNTALMINCKANGYTKVVITVPFRLP
jgi:hypothetical protein